MRTVWITSPVRILAYCLMPNHFHLVVWPREDGDLSRWMQRVLTAQVRRYHEHYHTLGEGHLWQGRFKAFPIQTDEHLLTVVRYVERNPVRAGLAERAERWKWSSAPGRRDGTAAVWMDPGPVAWPKDWELWVNAEEGQEELESLRKCVVRGRPWGGENWVARIVRQLGLEHSVRPRGRPKKR